MEGKTLEKGEVVCAYEGELVSAAEGRKREEKKRESDSNHMAYAMWFDGVWRGQREGDNPVSLW